jgi:DNA end-binding protein Ku
MAYRPSWQGHLKLSLVTCPVALYTATNSGGDVHFHLINPATNNRIKMITTDPDTGPVERSELVKGYEVSKGEYVILTDEEIKSVKLESTKTIDIERFVPEAEIDRIYWDNPYFLAPDGEIAQEAFAVIRAAMEKSGRIALGRIVLATRERILALEPRGRGILAYTIRSDAEVRKPDEIFGSIPDTKPDPEMIAIAEKIIDRHRQPALGHHLHQVSQAQLKAKIPAHAQDDDAALEVATLEQLFYSLQLGHCRPRLVQPASVRIGPCHLHQSRQENCFRDIRAQDAQTGASFSSTGSPCSSVWPVSVRVSGAGMPLVLYSPRIASFRAIRAIAKLVHIDTGRLGLGEDSLGALLLLVNVMLYLFRQHLDLAS